MPSGKCRVLSVSGRHNDDRWWNTPGVFRKVSEAFYNFWSLPISYGNCRSALYPCYVKRHLPDKGHTKAVRVDRSKTTLTIFPRMFRVITEGIGCEMIMNHDVSYSDFWNCGICMLTSLVATIRWGNMFWNWFPRASPMSVRAWNIHGTSWSIFSSFKLITRTLL